MFTSDGLSRLWNEMVIDGELCGNKCDFSIRNDWNILLSLAATWPGQHHCQLWRHQPQLRQQHHNTSTQHGDLASRGRHHDQELTGRVTRTHSISLLSNVTDLCLQEIISSWSWAEQPSEEQLGACLASIISEQSSLMAGAARNTRSSVTLRQRLCVVQRYLTAVSRSTSKSG